MAPGGRKPRALLAELLIHANELVSADRLSRTFGPRTPGRRAKRASNDCQTAPKALGDRDRILTVSPGYAIRVDADELDRDGFERLLSDGRQALMSGDHRGASTSLGRSFPLAGLRSS